MLILNLAPIEMTTFIQDKNFQQSQKKMVKKIDFLDFSDFLNSIVVVKSGDLKLILEDGQIEDIISSVIDISAKSEF